MKPTFDTSVRWGSPYLQFVAQNRRYMPQIDRYFKDIKKTEGMVCEERKKELRDLLAGKGMLTFGREVVHRKNEKKGTALNSKIIHNFFESSTVRANLLISLSPHADEGPK